MSNRLKIGRREMVRHRCKREPLGFDSRGMGIRLLQIFVGFLMGLLVLMVISLCSGCSRRVVYVPAESVSMQRDSVRSAALRVDSVWVRDSVYVERVSGASGDTVRIEHWRDRWRDRVVSDTAVKLRVDSVRVKEPYPVEVVKEVNRLRWWQTALMWLGVAGVVIAGGWLAIKILRRYYKSR